jgi:hypothetical protein
VIFGRDYGRYPAQFEANIMAKKISFVLHPKKGRTSFKVYKHSKKLAHTMHVYLLWTNVHFEIFGPCVNVHDLFPFYKFPFAQ